MREGRGDAAGLQEVKSEDLGTDKGAIRKVSSSRNPPGKMQ